MAYSGELYGQALHELAVEEGREQSILQSLSVVAEVLSLQPGYLDLVDSHSISKEERVALLDQAFTDRVDPLVLNMLKMLAERSAMRCFKGCRKAYIQSYNAKHNIAEATVVSATELSDEQKRRVLNLLEDKSGKTVHADYIVDASLGAGLRVEMDGISYDNTISSRIQGLAKALLKGN